MAEYENCLDCPHHKIILDPDPTDWFNDDDEAVFCDIKLKDQEDFDKKSKINIKLAEYGIKPHIWKSELHPNKMITVSCRPYNLENECKPIPEWCPLKNNLINEE
jgi:hypothetical protein